MPPREGAHTTEATTPTMSIGFAIPELIALAVMLALPALMLVALIDLVQRPEAAWSAAGQNQLVWAFLIVFVAVIGPVLYFLVAYPRLRRAEADREMAAFAATFGPAPFPSEQPASR